MPPREWSGRYAQERTAACLEAWGRTCHLCSRAGATSADHLIPRTLGGSDDLENLRPAHKLCNQLRGRQPVTPELIAYILERTAALWPGRVDARDAFDGWSSL